LAIPHDRQSQAAAGGALVQPHKALEHRFALGAGMPGPESSTTSSLDLPDHAPRRKKFLLTPEFMR
jgi:hypothetical protein